MLSDCNRILVIAAHPDDEVLGCGGAIAKLADLGRVVRVVFLGEGSTCRFDVADIDSPEARDAIEQREVAARQALKILNVDDVLFRDLSCGRFDREPIIDIGKLVEREIAEFVPDTVFTHSMVDANVDHRITFQAALQATRPGAQNFVPNLLSFEVPSSTEWRFTEQFAPNLFIGIEDELERKLAAFEMYATEIRPYPFPRSVEGLRSISRVRGMQAGLPYAEAFVIVRSLIH
mgnify:CR=1 FL=1